MVLLSTLFLVATVRQDQSGAALPAAVQAVADRPNVYKTRTYVPQALPTFAEVKSKLPEPIISIHPEWVDLYWKAWDLAFQHLKQPEPGSGFVSNFIDPAFNANTFQWDTCFMLQFAHYAEPSFHAIGSLDNFYAKQHADGYICREISRKTGEDFAFGGVINTINPPLFSWVEWQNYLLTGDKSRFKDVLPRLVKYYQWLSENRRRPDGLYWNTGLGAGEDDLIRNESTYAWVDMTAQQAQNAYCISLIAKELNEKETEEFFLKELNTLGSLINAKMWDAKSGFYYDLKKDGSPTGIKTVLGFWPLLAHVATLKQASQLVQHLLNPDEFMRPNVVPALAANEPGYTPDGQYWNGAVWAPTNFMVVKGLQEYGFEDQAEEISARYLANMSRVLSETHTIWENYAPEFAMGHGVKDMVGWSGIGPISLLIENILGIRTSAAKNEVSWRIRLLGKNGIKNLTVGKLHVSLMASTVVFDKRRVDVTCDAPFKLNLEGGTDKISTFMVPKGTSSYSVDAPSAFTMSYPTVTPSSTQFVINPHDIALHKTATATSEQGQDLSASNAVDGSGTTRWSSSETIPQSLTVDLGGSHRVAGVSLSWEAAFARSYTIEISQDGIVWNKVFGTTAGKGRIEQIPIPEVRARFVRINCLSTDGLHKNVSLYEFQVIGL